ncbi:MAG: aminoglycoside 6'-N-acetyltransferase [Calditrichia bacterium]
MDIVPIEHQHLDIWYRLAAKLWPDEDEEGDLPETLADELAKPNVFAFLAQADQQFIGFVYLTLRADYVEGCSDSPTGFIEGLYLEPEYCGKGFGRELVQLAEQVARDKGCTEMGSNALIDNTASQAFHKAVGFAEVVRTVSFIKSIVPETDAD